MPVRDAHAAKATREDFETLSTEFGDLFTAQVRTIGKAFRSHQAALITSFVKVMQLVYSALVVQAFDGAQI